MLVTEATAADCSQASELIEGIDADYLLADRAYHTHAILCHCEQGGMLPVIPPKRNRKVPRDYDRYCDTGTGIFWKMPCCCSGVGEAFTRYAKYTPSFLAAVHIRCLFLWANIS